MNRKKFLIISGGTALVAAGSYYLSDESSFVRSDVKTDSPEKIPFMEDEKEILLLASLAPSGHNTQPWFIKYIEPYHWIIGNDKSKWLPAVDPTQRETILSIGAFAQNLEYAASSLGYTCQFDGMALSNQDENIIDVRLSKSGSTPKYDRKKIAERRTVRSNYLSETLRKEDLAYLINGETDFFHFIPNTAKEHQWLNEQTIEANRI
ncbi:MAG: nitroreductase, partial [Phycisphaerae bacterium]|nr:nitroreductase [Saprospiraceae bacterium]